MFWPRQKATQPQAGQKWNSIALPRVYSCVVPVTLAGCDSSDHLVDLLQSTEDTAIDDAGRCEVALDGYGYRWLRLRSQDSKRMA